jgi:hypothetical protein
MWREQPKAATFRTVGGEKMPQVVVDWLISPDCAQGWIVIDNLPESRG